jgi:hypothetical protein
MMILIDKITSLKVKVELARVCLFVFSLVEDGEVCREKGEKP